MLPRILTPDMPESDRRHWKIIRLDTIVELFGFPAEANVDTGHVVMTLVTPPAGDKPETRENRTWDFGPNGFAIVARTLLLLTGLSLALSGCAFKQRVQMFTQSDLANAAALAQASGDKIGAQCWASLEPVVAAAPNPAAEGLATGAERDRLLNASIGGPCGGLLAPRLLALLGQIPSAVAPLLHIPVP